MQLADKKQEEHLQENVNDSPENSAMQPEQIKATTANEGKHSLLDQDDLKEIALTNEEVEAVTRPDTEEGSPSGSSGPEEKDITG